MERNKGKPGFLRNFLVCLILFFVSMVAIRFVALRGESCDLCDFCFFSAPEYLHIVTDFGDLSKPSSAIIAIAGKSAPATTLKLPGLWATDGFQKAVRFYSSMFQGPMSDGVFSPNFKVLCIEMQMGSDVFALKDIGVEDSIGIFKKPLVISGQGFKQPFNDETFDFIFAGDGMVEKSVRPVDLAAEINRTLKPEGFRVVLVHTGTTDEYSFNSFIALFNCCKLVKNREIQGFN